MAYYRRSKSYGSSVSLLMTFVLGFALGMSVMYLFMALINGREGARQQGGSPQVSAKPLNATATLRNITEGRGRHIVPVVSPDSLRLLWRNVITELRPAVLVLRMENAGDPRTTREVLDMLAAFPRPPVVLMDISGGASLVGGTEGNVDAPGASVPEQVLETIRQWGGSGWLGPCLAFAPGASPVALFGSSLPATAAVKLGLDINRTLLEHGMAAAVWPFPGVATTTSPEGYALITESDFDVLAGMVEPFLQAIQAGTPALVVNQVVVPALDARKPPRPACASPVIIRELLREKWQYDGLVLGDVTVPPVVADDEDPSTLPVRCVAAGCDAVLVDFDRQDIAVGMLMSFDLNGLPPDQLAASAERLERFRARYAVRSPSASEPATPAAAPETKPASSPPMDVPESTPSTGVIAPQPPLVSAPDGDTTTTNALSVSAPEESPAAAEPTPSAGPEAPENAETAASEKAPTTESSPAEAAAAGEVSPQADTSEVQPVPQAPDAAVEPTPEPLQPTVPEGPCVMHRVEPGEGLSTIAKKYGVSLSDLKQWNGITDPDRIVSGTVLKIYGVQQDEPGPATGEAVPPDAASNHEEQSKEASEVPAPAQPSSPETSAGDEIKSTPEAVNLPKGDDTIYEVYVVQPGDTLSRIAGRYGISQAELMRINDIQDRNLVKIGSKLKVPRTPGSGGEQGTPAE